MIKTEQLDYNDLVEIIHINTVDELYNVKKSYYPNGEEKFPIIFRQKCIFRGIGNVNYELVPKALRKQGKKYIINDYIGSKIFFNEYHSTVFEDINCNYDDEDLTLEGLFKRELFVLFKFLDWADKSGLDVPLNKDIRKLLHSHIDNFPEYWPQSEFFEIISLAQHYQLPTEALDWTYDYKVALYFAVENLLKNDESDCVLWAFNYKPFEKYASYDLSSEAIKRNKSQLRFYRPKYYNNPNLKAQKGLFTFIINTNDNFNEKPLDKMITDEILDDSYEIKEDGIIIKLDGIPDFTLKNNEKIFYKFIINGKLKAKILKELYRDGYSEEYLFPGYSGVVLAMENRIKFEKYYNKLIFKDGLDIVLNINEFELNDIFNDKIDYLYRNFSFKDTIDKIFICFKNQIYGYFNGNQISKHYSKDDKSLEEGIEIKINHFKKFTYPIKIKNLNKKDFTYILENDNLKFLLNFKDCGF